MVRVAPIIKGMQHTVEHNEIWQAHFVHIFRNSAESQENVLPVLIRACGWLADRAKTFHRKTLQTRFFETGDNFYLGMEMLREYHHWKKHVVKQLLNLASEELQSGLEKELTTSVDRLWYENCLETIRKGDVYNPGARHRVPKLFLIDSLITQPLSDLSLGESFRIAGASDERYEILDKSGSQIVVRSVEGFVSWMEKATLVFRDGNLTRGPDGNQESKVVSIHSCWNTVTSDTC